MFFERRGAQYNFSKAAEEGDLRELNKWIKADVNINFSDSHPDGAQLALFVASKNGHNEIVQRLIQAGALVNISINGVTPLMAASSNGHIAIVKQLIKAGAIINLQLMSCQATALTAAAENGHAAVDDVLLRAGADPKIKGQKRWCNRLIGSN